MKTHTRRRLLLCVALFLAVIMYSESFTHIAEAQGIARPKDNSLPLLQPLDDGDPTLDAEAGLGSFFTYFNRSWPWVMGIAAGVGVLWALVGGIEIMISGSDGGRRDSGKSRLLWALAGLLMVGLAGLILQTLNPLFYNQV